MSTAPRQSMAIAKVDDLVLEPLKRIEDLRTQIARIRPQANLVCPVASVDSILAMHQISLRVVVIDSTITNPATGNGPEVYKGKFCDGNERALGKVALEKIDGAAGVQLLYKRRLDDRSDPFYCEIEVTKGLRDFDGTWRQTTKTKAVDLRDGAPDALKLKDKPAMLGETRSRIQELAETKAGLRATRSLLNLRQKYTVEELSKPFVVPKLVPALDPNDPDQKAALIAMATGREMGLYGPQPSESHRQLRDVTPPPALALAPALNPEKGNPPPPVGSVPSSIDEPEADEPAAGGDFDMPSFEEPAAVIEVCSCPCGDQAQVTSDVAQMTRDRVGAVRCRDCFPGKGFNYEKHKGLRGPLGLPSQPKLTADDVKAALDRAAKSGK